MRKEIGNTIDMRIQHTLDIKMRNPARFMGFIVVLTIIAGVIVDVDHPIAFWLGIADGRFLMPYFNLAGYILVGCGIVLLFTCLGRYIQSRLLRN